MTQQTLINSNNNPDPQIDDSKNYLTELVGEGKKFKSPEELAKGKAISDAYITTMEREKDELRQDYLKLKADYDSRAKIEELMDQLSKPQTPTNVSAQPLADPVKPEYDPKQIESLVSQKLVEHEASKRQAENFTLVRNKLTERYGENYQPALTKQIQELGLTKEFVDDLARSHPQVLFKTLGLDQAPQREPFQAPTRTQQAFAPTGEKKRTWSFYQQMRRDNPKLYHDPKTVVQMHNDAIRLGEDFEDGDYKAY